MVTVLCAACSVEQGSPYTVFVLEVLQHAVPYLRTRLFDLIGFNNDSGIVKIHKTMTLLDTHKLLQSSRMLISVLLLSPYSNIALLVTASVIYVLSSAVLQFRYSTNDQFKSRLTKNSNMYFHS